MTDLKCTFSDVLEIASKRFVESGILRGECPDCAALRQLSFRKEILRFPPQDKRKTRTPQTDRRRARCEKTWEVVGGERGVE